ncbi:hypothetical protein [Pilimelia terevasa]|nr:hypothetical protein [Pilimelia terevasa]
MTEPTIDELRRAGTVRSEPVAAAFAAPAPVVPDTTPPARMPTTSRTRQP